MWHAGAVCHWLAGAALRVRLALAFPLGSPPRFPFPPPSSHPRHPRSCDRLFPFFPPRPFSLLSFSHSLDRFTSPHGVRHSFRHHYIPLGLDPRTRVSTTKRPTTTISTTSPFESHPNFARPRRLVARKTFLTRSTFRHLSIPSTPIQSPELLRCTPLLRLSHLFDETRPPTTEASLYQSTL